MDKIAVLAYSGGLDTSYCAAYLGERGFSVHAVAVQTGGFCEEALASMASRARQLGVAVFEVIDAQGELFDDYLKYLIFANALRGEIYPLCVAAERVVQAKRVAQYAASVGASALAHGSTGAGNDQVRFDVAFRAFAPELDVITPIRAQALSREAEVAYLARRGVAVPDKTGTYSVNRGLWGATIGGAETHSSTGVLPESAYELTAGAFTAEGEARARSEALTLEFAAGVPVGLDGAASDPVTLIEALNARAGRFGIGRGMHVGDTILGIKGRVAFEAPAATVLIAAHRELEKLVLSRQQLFWKRTLGDLYGANLHEARSLDPVMRDLEAFLRSSQARVTGRVDVRFEPGRATMLGASSPHSLLGARGTCYGEGSALWTGAEAAGFCKVYGMSDMLQRAAEVGE